MAYELRLPTLPGRPRFNAVSDRIGLCWAKRWRERVYEAACRDLALCREEGRTFSVWCCCLEVELTYLGEAEASFLLSVEEKQARGCTDRLCWGENWDLAQDAPILPVTFLRHTLGRRHLKPEDVLTEGRNRLSRQLWWPDRDWEERLPPWLRRVEPWRRGDVVEFALPMCTLATAAEGTPTFSLPIDHGAVPYNREKSGPHCQKGL